MFNFQMKLLHVKVYLYKDIIMVNFLLDDFVNIFINILVHVLSNLYKSYIKMNRQIKIMKECKDD